MNKASEVAYKIINGEMLTIDEFKIALNKGYFQGTPTPKNETEWAKAYLTFTGQHYETPEYRAWICGKHPSSNLGKDIDGYEHICAWGIHLDKLERKYLTTENMRYLKRHFGVKQVNSLLK